MRLEPNPARTTHCCKIKAVNPPFRSVSTPRWGKDFHVLGAVNPELARGSAPGCRSASEWSPEQLSEKLRTELDKSAWDRLVRAAASQGTSVDQMLRAGRLEAV